MYIGVHEAVWLGHMFILAGLYMYTLSVATVKWYCSGFSGQGSPREFNISV